MGKVMIERARHEGEELPCIWVMAGVLSYRLCDRNYQCEECELFHALRGESGQARRNADLPAGFAEGTELPASASTVEELVNAYLCRLTDGCKLYVDRPYCPCHFWLDSPQAGQVIIGLDGYVMRVLYPVDDIVMPRAGVLMKRAEPCGWITRGRKTIPLSAPISGEIEAVNEPYIESVRVHGGVNGGDEWLLRLKAHEDLDTVPGLYRGEEPLTWYLKKIQLLKRYLREAVDPGVQEVVGVTLNDGGEANLDMEQVLGREQFERLVDEMFRMQI